MKPGFLVSFATMIAFGAYSQTTFPLYDGPIPNAKEIKDNEETNNRDGIVIVSNISRPTITVYPAPKEKSNGTAIIIFPGGGYWVNAIQHEGIDVAQAFNEWGVTAFVVKYRIPNDATMKDKETGPLQDAQQAMQWVRQRAAEWSIDPARVGIMGFSAGGHLASTLGTHFKKPVLPDMKSNLRPDFMILVYPVISFQNDVGHLGSRDQLIGKEPRQDKIDLYSNELQVTPETPPTFLIHATDDSTVDSENSIRFYQALKKNKVPAELHIYRQGGHGFGMNNKTTDDRWMERCKNWMKTSGWIK